MIYDGTLGKVNKYRVGDIIDFIYQGKVSEIFLNPGEYLLEVWGASGGDANSPYLGGEGGYSKGSIRLYKDTKLFVCVGGAGVSFNHASSTWVQVYKGGGGYNGGAGAGLASGYSGRGIGSGGGCTSICKDENLGELYNYVNKKHLVLIVAGGGSGGNTYWGSAATYFYVYGAKGGGLTGEHRLTSSNNWSWTHREPNCYGGGQTPTDAAGRTHLFGKAVDSLSINQIGAGGGYYGGVSNTLLGASGGSGFIGNVRDGETTQGGNKGNGKARITKTKEIGIVAVKSKNEILFSL